MTMESAWLDLFDYRNWAQHYLKEQRGKPGEATALHNMRKAEKQFDEVSRLF